MDEKQIPQPYQLKVSLLGSRPPIWRRLLVPSDLTLGDLHTILQTAMGWLDSHLHEFRIGGQTYGRPDREDSFVDRPQPSDERKVRLDGAIRMVGADLIYAYDFGDDWEHEVVLEKILPPVSGRRYPACLGGERHCPPEDCGGVPGYEELLRVIRDRHHPDHADTRRWLGGDFDPEQFSVDEVNRSLARFMSRGNLAAPNPYEI